MLTNRKIFLCVLSVFVLSNHVAYSEISNESDAQVSKTVKKNSKKQFKSMTLNDAINYALRNSPRLLAYKSSIDVAKGEFKQAGATRNPELGIEVENFGGNGSYSGLSSAEITYGVTQEIEIGGKIGARERVASKSIDIASHEYKSAALDLVRDVTVAYVDAVAADQNVTIAIEQKKLAQEVLDSVSTRVNAAAAPLLQKGRAEVELSTATISLDTAMRERDIARKNLSVLMGEKHFSSSLNSQAFYLPSLSNTQSFDGQFKSNPDLAKLNAALEQSRAKFDLERANAIPNPSVNIGVRDFRESGDQAVVAGLSIPIPIFDSNQGNIEKAISEINKTQQENQDKSLTLNSELYKAKEQMKNAFIRVKTLKNEILPSAEKVFQLAREGYGLGRLSYLEVLDAQRSFFTVKQQYILALKEFHIARSSVERLTAVHLVKIQK